MAKNTDRYFAAVAYLDGLPRRPGHRSKAFPNPALRLRRMQGFLDLLGNPERGLKYIHVTGTAGKGTVSTMLHEALSASGERVGSYTSPFTTTSIEKIRVGELFIDPDEFADIVESMKPVIDEMRPTYFEVFFALALIYFLRQGCAWAVVEVGIGGRFDFTNVIPNPVATVITNVDYDHTELLGKTLKKIAFDKAGIIKSGSAFFTAEQRPGLQKMFIDVCAEEGATFHAVPREKSADAYNRSLVRCIGEALGFSSLAIEQGIKRAQLPCRFETMQRSPMTVLDGAHNRIKMRSVAERIAKESYRKLHVIVGMTGKHNHEAVLKQIMPLADSVTFTSLPSDRSLCADPEVLLKKAKPYFTSSSSVRIIVDPTEALSTVLQSADAEDCVLVTGSFFLVGELRKRWVTEEEILHNRRLSSLV